MKNTGAPLFVRQMCNESHIRAVAIMVQPSSICLTTNICYESVKAARSVGIWEKILYSEISIYWMGHTELGAHLENDGLNDPNLENSCELKGPSQVPEKTILLFLRTNISQRCCK